MSRRDVWVPIVTLVMSGAAAAQATLHVAPAGNDRTGDGSARAPFASIDVAVTRAQAIGDGGSVKARFSDVDGDGDQDLLLVQGEGLGMNENIGDRTRPRFLPPRWVSGARFPPSPTQEICSAPVDFHFDLSDADQDGRRDLFVTRPDGHLWYLRNLSRPGAVAFAQPVEIPLPGASWATGIVAADLDGDQKEDLLIGSIVDPGAVYLLPRIAHGSPPVFGAPGVIFASVRSPSLALVDMDGDGQRDLVAWARHSPRSERPLHFHRNTGSNVAPRFSALGPMVATAGWLAEADLDGDGRDEMYGAVLGPDRLGVRVLRVPRSPNGLPDLAGGVALRYEPSWPAPARITVEVPPGPARYVTSFPLLLDGPLQLVATATTPDAGSPRVRIDTLAVMPGFKILSQLAPRQQVIAAAGNAMILLTGTAPVISGFELVGGDPALTTGIESRAQSAVIDRVGVQGLAFGILAHGGAPTLQRCAAFGTGVGVLIEGGTVRGCTLAGNRTGLSSLVLGGAPPTRVIDSILAGNAQIDLAGTGPCAIDSSFVGSIGSLVTVTAINLRRGDPGLRDPVRGDLRLRPTSPAIDAGSAPVTAMDLDGNPGCVGRRPDLGAYEWTPVTLGTRVLDAGRGDLRVSFDRPAGTLPVLLAGTLAARATATPFGDLLLGRAWLLAPSPDGRLTLGDLRALTGTSLFFQGFAIDAGQGAGWASNVVEWPLR